MITTAEQDPKDLRAERRMLCVAFVDVVGFSALMHGDEEGTFQLWIDLRDGLVLPLLAEYGGENIKLTGDGILAAFEDSADALRWSRDVQSQARQRRQGLAMRIALNHCLVMPDGYDLLGDGVNIAARLQERAPSGGVILTQSVVDNLPDPFDFDLQPIGRMPLRGIQQSPETYVLFTDARDHAQRDPDAGTKTLPSIAVLPFTRLAAGEDDQYFATGIVEDISVALSCHRDLTVISRSSTLAFARQNVEPRVLGHVLGVHYMIRGTIRRSGEMIRISAELLDTETARQVASFKTDFKAAQTFQVQDAIVETTLGHLLPGMQAEERRRTLRKWPENFTAYDHYLKAIDLIGSLERDEFQTALTHLDRAMTEDPGFS